VLKEVEIRGALTYRRADFAEAIDLLARGRIPVDELISSTAPLERAEEMFQALTAPGNTQVKVLLEPGIGRETGASSREDPDGHQRRAG
jgi:threonine dehydrogenase-like Zn-dependent dehydrogenase